MLSPRRSLLITVHWLAVFLYFYAKYARVIDEKLRAGVFANTAKIYRRAGIGGGGRCRHTRTKSPAELRRSGYNESRGNPVGYYQIHPNCHRDLPGQGFLLRPGSRA